MPQSTSSSFLIPSTPASFSQAPSDGFSEPQSNQMNIWTLFRLAKGSEAKHITITTHGNAKKKILHYCISCETRKIKPIWSNAFAGNAKDHIQRKHKAEWQEWYHNQ